MIKPENTAISNGVAQSAYELEKTSTTKHAILDYGAGKLRNAKYLQRKGFCVSILDTPLQISKLSNCELKQFESVFTPDNLPSVKYDRILCSYVLNVIPKAEERLTILKNIHYLLKDDGLLFCQVRGESGILSNKYRTQYLDGFLVGKNSVKTFQKPYTIIEIKELFNNNMFEVVKSITGNDSHIVVARKRGFL